MNSPTAIAEGLGSYFSSICTPEITTHQPKNELVCEFASNSINYLGFFDNISVENVDKMISKMKTGKAQDADGLTIEHIDYAHPALKLLLSKLFNYCLHAGVVPTRFG